MEDYGGVGRVPEWFKDYVGAEIRKGNNIYLMVLVCTFNVLSVAATYK